MASVQDIKRRIRSVRNTRKITKAMELVAAARLRRAQARIEAMRPYADRMHGADGRHRARELVASAGCRCCSGARCRRSRSSRSPATAASPARSTRRCCGARSRSSAAARRGQGRPLARRRQEGRARRCASAATRSTQAWTGLHRPARLRRRAGDRAPRWPSCTRTSEVDRVVIVYNHFVSPLVQRVDRAGGAADPGGASLEADEDEERERRARSATSSTSPSRRRSSSACCRSTSRPRSTARCSSRPRPSRARG